MIILLVRAVYAKRFKSGPKTTVGVRPSLTIQNTKVVVDLLAISTETVADKTLYFLYRKANLFGLRYS